MIGRCVLLAVAALAVVGELYGAAMPPAAWQFQTTSTFILPKLLLWNASASAPTGLYLLRRAAPLERGELVVVAPPEPLANWLARRGYLPNDVPLLKHIAALPGQRVCRRGDTVSVDGAAVAKALHLDHLRRSLPEWKGCRPLRAGEVFLLNSAADSMDGRYFGPLPIAAVRQEALPLWTQASR